MKRPNKKLLESTQRPEGFTHMDNSFRVIFVGHSKGCPDCNEVWQEIAESLAYDGVEVNTERFCDV